jgi:hypothetical protein
MCHSVTASLHTGKVENGRKITCVFSRHVMGIAALHPGYSRHKIYFDTLFSMWLLVQDMLPLDESSNGIGHYMEPVTMYPSHVGIQSSITKLLRRVKICLTYFAPR